MQGPEELTEEQKTEIERLMEIPIDELVTFLGSRLLRATLEPRKPGPIEGNIFEEDCEMCGESHPISEYVQAVNKRVKNPEMYAMPDSSRGDIDLICLGCLETCRVKRGR